MSRPAPASLAISKPSQFILPSLAQEPLRTALRNVNAVWLYHQPALVQSLPADDYGTNPTAGATYLIPIIPSADALPYRFSLATDSSITVTRTYYVSSDTTIAGATYTQIGTDSGSTGADGVVVDGSYTVPAATTHLKVVISTTGSMFPQSLLVYPYPSSVPSAVQSSGFVPYDDGILEGATGAPIHQEFLDRCRKSALSVWHDRRQNSYSLVCNSAPDEGEGEGYAVEIGSTATITMPIGRMVLPGYTQATRFVAKAIAVSSGATVTGAIKLKLTGIDQATIELDASGDIESGTATVIPNEAGLAQGVDVELELSGKGTAQFVVHSIMIWPEAS